jgi:hypothetical protein
MKRPAALWLWLLCASSALLSFSVSAGAGPSNHSRQHDAVAKGVAKGAASKAPVENDPLPNVTLTLEAPATRGTWFMRVSNDGEVPVRIVADARLLALDVFARGARDPVRCELPPDMRPDDDLERPLVLPPHRAYKESFEPALYCLGTKKLDALSPAAIVVAHLGWKGRSTRFLEVSAIEGIEPRVSARPAIDAPPIALPDEPTPASIPAPTASDALDDPPRLSLRSAGAVDAESVSRLEIPVTLRNDGERPVVVRFRPETLRFDVVGPEKPEHCAWPALPGAPQRDLFATLRPKGTTSLNVTLGTYCPTHTFDQAGLYLVTAHLDTRAASGSTLGLHTFDGEVAATFSTAVRLRRGRSPKVSPPPHLEP